MNRSLEIIVPCFNEAECVELLYQRVSDVLPEEREWSLIFIDDGSTDETMKAIENLVERFGDSNIKYISFSKNFGKESAIIAGLVYSKADYVLLMDADLQHPPELIPEMISQLDKGYDCCGARRVSRKGEPVLKSLFSEAFYKFINKVTSMNLVEGGSDFRMMKRQVVDVIVSMEERERFTKGIFSWIGFNTKWIEYKNVERVAGTTKWSIGGLFKYAVSGYISFATAPLRIAVYIGFVIDVITFFAAIIFTIVTLNSDMPRTGYGTLVVLMAFFGGTIILLLGIVGEYLARIYTEVKHRPLFIVKRSNIDLE